MSTTQVGTSFSVNVKLPNNASKTLNLCQNDTINDVKKLICCKPDLKVSKIELILSGKFLEDQTFVKDLCLGEESVLHVYQRPKSATNQASVTPGSTSTPGGHYQYYVYCKTCDGLQTGKIRVKCSVCLQGAIVLNQEPRCWDDVLLPSRLDGLCTVCELNHPAEFYFKCCNHDSSDTSIPLRYIRPNTQNVECVTCTDVRSPILVYPCQDKHVLCIECFQSYARVSLDSRSFTQDTDIGYSLPCPVGCDNSLVRDVHHFYLLGKQQYERYKDFGAEECLLQTGGVICPQAGCGEGMVVDTGATNVQCRTCQFEFCRHCKEEIHNGPCHREDTGEPNLLPNVEADRALRSRWDSQSIHTIQQTTKPCPNCKTRTERNDGCMHLRCPRCQQDWCWMCETPWNRSCQGSHWFG